MRSIQLGLIVAMGTLISACKPVEDSVITLSFWENQHLRQLDQEFSVTNLIIWDSYLDWYGIALRLQATAVTNPPPQRSAIPAGQTDSNGVNRITASSVLSAKANSTESRPQSCTGNCLVEALVANIEADFEREFLQLERQTVRALQLANKNVHRIAAITHAEQTKRNTNRAKMSNQKACELYIPPVSNTLTYVLDATIPLIRLARTRSNDLHDARSIGPGWHLSLDTRIILGVESPLLSKKIALQQSTVNALKNTVVMIDYALAEFANRYRDQIGFYSSAVKQKLLEVSTRLYQQRQRITHLEPQAEDILPRAMQDLEQYRALKARSDVRNLKNTYSVAANAVESAELGVDVIRWVAPTGALLTFADPQQGEITQQCTPPVEIVRTDNGYRVATPEGLFYYYDAYGLLSKVENSLGQYLLVSRDQEQRVVQLSDRHGSQWQLAYNEVGYLSSVTNSAKRVLLYQYDDNHHLNRVIDSTPTH